MEQLTAILASEGGGAIPPLAARHKENDMNQTFEVNGSKYATRSGDYGTVSIVRFGVSWFPYIVEVGEMLDVMEAVRGDSLDRYHELFGADADQYHDSLLAEWRYEWDGDESHPSEDYDYLVGSGCGLVEHEVSLQYEDVF